MQRWIIALKGMVMGFADVIPGVSGGTMALILGIYVQFIEGVKSVNFRWVAPLFRWVLSGFSKERRDAVLDPLRAIHWDFLVPLALGIFVAFGIGARVVPSLMDRFPTEMAAFFIGLILASCVLPIRSMPTRGPRELVLGVVFATVTFFGIGSHSEPVLTWSVHTETSDMTLMEFTRRHPSVRTPEQLYCAREGRDNAPLRDAVRMSGASRADGTLAAGFLDHVCAELSSRSSELESWVRWRDEAPELRSTIDGRSILTRKHPENPFDTVVVPAGTPVQVPAPAYWFIFLCGVIGICAMVLPGISGSFLLLLLGAYHFLLSGALKGFLSEAARLRFPQTQFAYVAVFALGCGIGLLTFARVMSWLFRKVPSQTLAAMVGIMLGSLRMLWPFKLGEPSVGVVNFLPTASEAFVPILVMTFGAALVAVLTWLGARFASEPAPASPVVEI
jgi:uncharacterized membrane protein